jgi:hypothetical protein
MISNDSLEVFEYFLSCYFNQSTDFNNLSILGSEFKESEDEHRIEKLVNELKLLKATENWEFVQKFIAKHGMRSLSISQAQETIDILVQVLLETDL